MAADCVWSGRVPEDIGAAVERLFGIVTPTYRLGALRDALTEVGNGAVETGLARVAAGGPEAMRRLEAAASIPETFLFRHPGHYDLLAGFAAERLGRGLATRVLSAGASTGEEAWSAAAVLVTAGRPAAGAHRVIGWELADDRVELARRGRFNAWAARAGVGALAACFRVEGDELVANDELRAITQFQRVNLTDPQLPMMAAVDVIFFRNVAIYWKPQVAARVMAALAELLDDGGLFLVGPSDPVTVPGPGWEHAIEHGVRVIRRVEPSLTPVVRVPERRSPGPASPAQRRRFAGGEGAAATTSRPLGRPSAASPSTDEDGAAPAPTFADVADLADRGSYREALALLESSQLGRDEAGAVWCGILELNLERPEAAVRSFRRAVFLAPDDLAARHWLAVAFDRLGCGAEAARERANAARLAGGAQ